jgi:hypothetical protein
LNTSTMRPEESIVEPFGWGMLNITAAPTSSLRQCLRIGQPEVFPLASWCHSSLGVLVDSAVTKKLRSPAKCYRLSGSVSDARILMSSWYTSRKNCKTSSARLLPSE